MSLVTDRHEILVEAFRTEFPIITEYSMRIPFKFSNELPDNLMEYATTINERFLNKYQGMIEDVFNKNQLRLFQNYQNKHFTYRNDSGNLKENLFKKCNCNTKNQIENMIIESILGDFNGFQVNPFTLLPTNTRFSNMVINPFYVQAGGCTEGSDIATASTSTRTQTAQNFMQSGKTSGGTQDECYDRIAISVDTGSGNINLGCYDDSSGDPNNKLAQTGSISSPSSSTYDWQNVTEFNLDTATVWLSIVADNGTFAYDGEDITGTSRDRTFTFNTTLPDPYGTPIDQNTNPTEKIGHT